MGLWNFQQLHSLLPSPIWLMFYRLISIYINIGPGHTSVCVSKTRTPLIYIYTRWTCSRKLWSCLFFNRDRNHGESGRRESRGASETRASRKSSDDGRRASSIWIEERDVIGRRERSPDFFFWPNSLFFNYDRAKNGYNRITDPNRNNLTEIFW